MVYGVNHQQQQVGLDYRALPDEVTVGDRLLLGDGRIVLQVEQSAIAQLLRRDEVA